MADVADNGLIFHLHQVLITDHLIVASGRHEDVHLIHHIVQTDDAIALHGRLKCTDRIHLCNADGGTKTTQGLGGTLTDIAVANDQSLLASHHDVRGTFDAVDQRLTAAIQVVELAFGD